MVDVNDKGYIQFSKMYAQGDIAQFKQVAFGLMDTVVEEHLKSRIGVAKVSLGKKFASEIVRRK